MRLEPIYTVTFTTPEAWSVSLPGTPASKVAGSDSPDVLQEFGRPEGRPSSATVGSYAHGTAWSRYRSLECRTIAEWPGSWESAPKRSASG
jgi:hypothetical protein